MALVLADRVKETTTTVGTGTITLDGATPGYQSFAAVGNGNTTYYTIAGQTTSEWEVGIGTYTSSGTTLSRDTVLSSSAGGAKVTFSAGTKDVFVTQPSSRAAYVDGTTATFANSGVVPVASGGTGQTGYTNGQLLIGNTSTGGLSKATLTAGSNITITNGAGSIEISSASMVWSVKTGNYTAVNGDGVLANTTAGSFTVTLPATPSTGWQVFVADPTGTWSTNNLTIGRNGSTISGVAQDLVCDIAGISVQLVYSGTDWEVYAQVGGNGGTAVTLDGTQTLTNKTLTSPTITGALMSSMASSVLTLGTTQATTSGTAINFSSLPSWVRRITVMLSGVSTSGTSPPLLQIGSGGTIQNTGYLSGFNTFAGTNTSSTAGFVFGGTAAANTMYANLILCSLGSNIWVCTGVVYNGGVSNSANAGGVTLSGALTNIRLTTVNGTDTFDAGSMNILYE